ncbi:hypothetical protein GCM10009784_09660 [Arthrobacter parietis]|uniref:Uncharacterized protein n=2 Tax=Arthrobacter TaxID=1663 RepID=A0ABT6CS58_9MICC|nr:hypothetical protein [Arthrobacter vasquezii]MDF9276902.1 hypothetical protein [Arthrobacter vasquezii]
MRPLLISLLGVAALLILAGVSLLFGRPPAALPLPTAQSEASIAYGSELVIAYDDGASSSDLLTTAAGLLVLGGLMISAGAYGGRLAREAPDAD